MVGSWLDLEQLSKIFSGSEVVLTVAEGSRASCHEGRVVGVRHSH